jgi:hypothetical protein
VSIDTYTEDDDYIPPERMAELKRICQVMEASGVVLRVCICKPKRAEPHACKIDPDTATFTDFLMGL